MALTRFEFPGRPSTYGCPHMAVWLPLFSRLCQLRGIVDEHLDVSQVAGDYSGSGITHLDGTAADVWQHTPEVAELAREAGAPASWPRGPKFGQGSMSYHSHLVLDCPCVSRADYQIAAVKAGGDGLGVGGMAGDDYIPRPSVWRNYWDGLAWLRSQIDQLEEEMKLTDDDLDRIADRVWSKALPWPDGRGGTKHVSAKFAAYWIRNAISAVLRAVKGSDPVDAAEVYGAAYDGAQAGAQAGGDDEGPAA